MEAGEATRPPNKAEAPPHPPQLSRSGDPLQDRRVRDLFNRGATLLPGVLQPMEI